MPDAKTASGTPQIERQPNFEALRNKMQLGGTAAPIKPKLKLKLKPDQIKRVEPRSEQ